MLQSQATFETVMQVPDEIRAAYESLPDDGFANWLVDSANESDRGLAIVGAQHIDTCLRVLFERVLPNERDTELFNERGPLGTMFAKIEVAYALGVIEKPTYRDLTLIRRIRNDFAHPKAAGLTFESESIANRSSQLTRPTHFLPGTYDPDTSRGRFEGAITHLSGVIAAGATYWVSQQKNG